jgi:nitroreductase
MSIQTEAAALAGAARVGGFAPSIHNTQPWRWKVAGPELSLYAARQRQLAVTDPAGRMLTISCGAALHHARVALAAEGWQSTVDRVPEAADPDLLARVTVTGQAQVTAEAIRDLQTLQIRHTDRRPVSSVPVDPASLDALRATAEREGAHLHVMHHEDVLEVASAAAAAQRVENLDPDWVEELAYWVGGSNTPSAGAPTADGRGEGLGLPDEVIPSTPPLTTVPGRDFGHGGTLPVSEGHDRSATYAILNVDQDSRLGWLRGGEALSAVWLTAVEHDLSVLPLSAAVEVEQTRHSLRHLLAGIGEPLLVLRLGVPDQEHAGPPHTPRLPANQTIDIE